MWFYLVVCFIILYVLVDVNYWIRTYFTVLSGRLYQARQNLYDVSTIYGFCTYKDCDIWFNSMRLSRLVRELDFARYHFYDRTGIYKRSRVNNVHSLQGCTLTLTLDPVPLFSFYKINTKLVYYDDRSLFLEHEVITVRDRKVRCKMVSRQHAINSDGNASYIILQGITESKTLECPEYIQTWLKSMQITSEKLKQM